MSDKINADVNGDGKEATMTEQDMQLQIAIEQGKVNALRQEVAEMNEEREYWNQVRINAAIGIVSRAQFNFNKDNILSREDEFEIVAREAIKLADALVAELQKKGGQDETD